MQTAAGPVLGTVGYMSPEQVSGEPADARSDIFSLGCVLYEMLTGKRAFSGASPGQTMAAILRDHPPEICRLGRDRSRGTGSHRHAMPGEEPERAVPVGAGSGVRAEGDDGWLGGAVSEVPSTGAAAPSRPVRAAPG